MASASATPNALARAALVVLLGLQAAFCVAVLVRGPAVFPIGSPRFWTAEAAPLLLGLFALGAMRATLGGRGLSGWIAALSSFWVAAGLCSRVAFPISVGWTWWLPVLLGALTGILGRTQGAVATRQVGMAALPAIAVAAGLVCAQRAPEATTTPLLRTIPAFPEDEPSPPQSLDAQGARLDSTTGRVTFDCGGLELELAPMLAIGNTSPDRGWDLLARAPSPKPQPVRWSRDDRSVRLAFEQPFPQSLSIASVPGGALLLEAHSQLLEPVYSHLNSFLTVLVHETAPLSLSFSPCPVAFEALPMGYPTGAPGRHAFRTAAGLFEVVEASSGEKGPFRELASGPMGREEPLVITLLLGDQPRCRLTLDDWASQASEALSPTAGWGVPVNSIEFRRVDSATTAIVASLAATSVGDGWDVVGHAAGVYRNRVRVEPLRPDGR